MLSLEDYFRNPKETSFSISPNGQHIAYMAPYRDRLNIFVRDIMTDVNGGIKLGEPRQITFECERSIGGYIWKGDERIIFVRDNDGDENYQLFGVGIDGSGYRAYTPFEGVRVAIVDSLPMCPRQLIIQMNRRNAECFDPYRLHIETGELELLAENPGNWQGWTTDHDGKLRVVYAIVDGVNTQVLYRDAEDEEFKPVITTNFKDEIAFTLFTFDNREVYACTNINRDHTALVRMNPHTCEELELIYEDTRYDVASVVYSRLRKRLLFVYCSGHKDPIRHWIDKDERSFREHLYARFPGQRVSVADDDLQEERFLLRVGSDRTLGTYWLYDRRSDTFLRVGELAPWITPDDTVPMHAVTYQTRDKLTIEAYLSMPRGAEGPVPMVVHPHGGPWSRDYWGCNPLVQFLCSRGYGVFQMNFRGSTGYGRKFLEASYKQWGLKMQDDITDGVEWLIREGYADAKRIAIYGASYGGYAALAGICFTPKLYCCAVDYVGVSNLLTFMKTIPPYWRPMLEMMYEQVGNPETDREQLEATSPALHADAIRCPLFVAQGAKDPRVNKAESDQMVEALQNRGVEVEYMVKENEGHGFQNQENRFDFYRAMIRFLHKHMKAEEAI